jgi:DNA-binding XRE family transcriptional regulator
LTFLPVWQQTAAMTATRVRDGWTNAEIWQRHPTARIRLIRAREDAGLTRPELAERLGVSRFFVFSVETGRRKTRLDMMQAWAEILDIPLEFFLPPSARAKRHARIVETAA